MKVTKFEGTPEEFKAVAHLFGDNQPKRSTPAIEPKDAVRRMLSRLPVSDSQLAIYKALSKGRMEYQKFLGAVQKSGGQMAGVLGALGNRINNTPEIHDAGLSGTVEAILKWERIGETGYYISLRPHAIEALKEEGII